MRGRGDFREVFDDFDLKMRFLEVRVRVLKMLDFGGRGWDERGREDDKKPGILNAIFWVLV